MSAFLNAEWKGRGRGDLRPTPSLLVLFGLLALGAGCKGGANEAPAKAADAAQPVAVDARAVAQGRLREPLVLTGTTQPVEMVSVRARVEGHLESLTVDIGDVVKEGQELGRLDTSLLDAAVREAEAAVAAARAQAASAQAGVARARSAFEQSKLGQAQAKVEAERYAGLAERGIASRQEAEQRATAAGSSEQALSAAQQQIRTEEGLRKAALAQVQAQEALLSAARERLGFATLRAPLSGRVMARLHSPGDLVLAGAEVLRLGDFSKIEVAVSVSELDLSRVAVGKEVPIRLDAFESATFTGRIARISPQADPVSRLVPLELVFENPDQRIGSGLLARVQLDEGGESRIVVLETALSVGAAPAPDAGAENQPLLGADRARVFVLSEQVEGQPLTVEERIVQVGARADNQVEILSGLKEGERLVIRSQRPLRPGMQVRLSALSDAAGEEQGAGQRL